MPSIFALICDDLKNNLNYFIPRITIKRDIEKISIISISTDASVLRVKDVPLQKLCINMFNITYQISALEIINCDISDIEPNFLNNEKLISGLHILGNNILTIRKNIFVNIYIKRLELTNNNIVSIEKKAFAHLPILEELVLDSNYLTDLNPNWFSQPSNLKYLSLISNQIKILNEANFAFLTQDGSFVSLSNNKIERLDPETLNGIAGSNLTLILKQNLIREIPPNFFQNHSFIKLDFSFNLIKNLPSDFFEQDFQVDVFDINTLDQRDKQLLDKWLNVNNSALKLSILCTLFYSIVVLYFVR